MTKKELAMRRITEIECSLNLVDRLSKEKTISLTFGGSDKTGWIYLDIEVLCTPRGKELMRYAENTVLMEYKKRLVERLRVEKKELGELLLEED